MKKLFILALFVLGMCNAPVFGMEQEIVLTEFYSIMPFDDPGNETVGERPDPTQIRATIDGTRMRVNARTGAPVYVEVINQSTGEVVVEEEFVGETTMSIPDAGDYELYIYTNSGFVMMGEFEVK